MGDENLDENLIDLLQERGLILLAILAGSMVVALIVLSCRMAQLWKLHRRLEEVNPGVEALLKEVLEEQKRARAKFAEMEARLTRQEEILPRCLQRVGVIRYKAFDYIGSDQSFSIALLDAKGNGFVISSIAGTDECRIYAKPIVNGASSYNLSMEEREAIARATAPSK